MEAAIAQALLCALTPVILAATQPDYMGWPWARRLLIVTWVLGVGTLGRLVCVEGSEVSTDVASRLQSLALIFCSGAFLGGFTAYSRIREESR